MSGRGTGRVIENHHFADAGKMVDIGSNDQFVNANKMVELGFGRVKTDVMAPLDLGWRECCEKELTLMDDLVPILKKRATGRSISGLNAYEQ